MLDDTTRLVPVPGFRVLRKLSHAAEPAPSPPDVHGAGGSPDTTRAGSTAGLPRTPAGETSGAATGSRANAAAGAPDGTRTELVRTVTLTFDVLAGRRPGTVLKNVGLAARVRTGLTTRMRQGGEKGAALMSLHPDVRVCGTVAHFVGSWRSDRGIRAFTGRADRKSGDGPWSVTALRLL